MDRSAPKQILKNLHETNRIFLVVLVLSVAVAGCQSGIGTSERPLLPLFDAVQAPKEPPIVVFGPPSAVNTTQEITLTGSNQEVGDDSKTGAKEAKSTQAAVPASSSDIIDSCFVRDQVIDLENAFRLANLENPRIGLAEEAVRTHLAEQMIARSLLFPTLNVGATLSMHQGSLLSARGVVQDVNRESLYFGTGADVRGAGTVAGPGVHLISHLGDAVLAPRVAEQKVLSSRFDAAATRNNVLLEVANSYLALVGWEARFLALRQSEIEFAEVAKLTADFADKGQARDADAQRAKGALALLQSTSQRAEEDVIVRTTELSRWLSTDPTVRLRPEPGTPPLIQLIDDRADLESLIQTAIANRPEIVARNADVALYETRLRQERIRPLVPTISVGFSAGDFGGGSDQAGYRFSRFGGRTDLDILAVWTVRNLGLGNRAVQNKVRSEIGQAEVHRAYITEQVRREVAEALARTKASRQQMEIARRRVETAQKAYHQDLLRTKDRLGSFIEVFSSLNLLTAARQELVQSMVGYSQSQFQLYVALGGMPTSGQGVAGAKK